MAGHAEVFAARLSELKERSGRSYGALATRLHASASSLHRYCTGATVPVEFGPVERFARLCGASREEILALHQDWLLAITERRAEADAGRTGTDVSAGVEVVDAGSGRKLAIPAAVAAVVAIAVAIPLAMHVTRASGNKAANPPLATTDPLAPPVSVSVLFDNWDTECGQWFYATQPPTKVPPPPGLPDVPLWAAPLNAVPADHLRLQITAQAVPGQQPVVLHTLYVQVVGAKPAPKGFGYAMGSGCGGGLNPASFAVDLDAAAPKIRPVAGSPTDASLAPTPVLANFPFQISQSESQVLNVDAGTTKQDVSWYLELVWSSGTRQGTLRIDDHGKPFRTIGVTGIPLYFYNGTKWTPTDLF